MRAKTERKRQRAVIRQEIVEELLIRLRVVCDAFRASGILPQRVRRWELLRALETTLEADADPQLWDDEQTRPLHPRRGGRPHPGAGRASRLLCGGSWLGWPNPRGRGRDGLFTQE